MRRYTISLDIDGVIASGKYVPKWDRHPEVYASLEPVPDAISGLNKLTTLYNVYLVSGRNFPDALHVTREWLRRQDVDLASLAGTLVAQPRRLKAEVSAMLGAELHFDDDPRVIQMAGCRGVFFVSGEWHGYDSLVAHAPRVTSWPELHEFLHSYFHSQLKLPLVKAV